VVALDISEALYEAFGVPGEAVQPKQTLRRVDLHLTTK